MKNRHRIGYKTVDETKLTQVESTTIKESTGSKLASNLEEQAGDIIKPLSNIEQSSTITKVEDVISDAGVVGKGTTGTTSNGYKVSNGADSVIAKVDLEHPIVQSRINVQNGNNKAGWNHVVD